LHRDIAEDRESTLDEYGATNKAESFAVAPRRFSRSRSARAGIPKLYGQLRQFYQQDPARASAAPHDRVARRLIDVSHTIEHGMSPTGPSRAKRSATGVARPSQTRYAAGTTFQIGKIELLATRHLYRCAVPPVRGREGRRRLCSRPLRLEGSGPGTERTGRALDAGVFRGRDVRGKACSCTRLDVHWRTERYGNRPSLLDAGRGRASHRGRWALVASTRLTSTTRPTARARHTLFSARHSDRGAPVRACGSCPTPASVLRGAGQSAGMGSFPVRAFAVLRSDSNGAA